MSLLLPSETPPYELINSQAQNSAYPVVLCCDHATNLMPAGLNRLSVQDSVLSRHVALDVGAAELTRRLASHFKAPALLARFSRLVVDLNRYPSHPGFIPEIGDGDVIPGNQQLSRAQIAERRDVIFNPYHNSLARELRWQDTNRSVDAPELSALVCIHSFTPQLKVKGSEPRPWDVGVLWIEDDRMSRVMLDSLSTQSEICVGANQPYDGKHPLGYTPDYHAERIGRPYLLVEVRQDLIDNENGLQRWTDILCTGITATLDHLQGGSSSSG